MAGLSDLVDGRICIAAESGGDANAVMRAEDFARMAENLHEDPPKHVTFAKPIIRRVLWAEQ